ncbi:FixH family protein [Catenovulum sp. SM1970]|uniref:FixH family protein n=1 Tax=Marinifaba aquimaris TaxID=2741323 RepID=UPI001572811E|nr:FixH family protein [Marinifaba aquimaris]NTS77306.1 FixH family protein [Marinifaba aquimaris]
MAKDANETDVRPWYKEPWNYLLIVLPVSSVTAASIMISTFNQNNVEMVIDDYYKEGKAINQKLERIKQAKAFGITALLSIEDDLLLLDVNKNKNAPELAALSLSFFHSTQGKRDFKVMATQRADGKYLARLPDAIKGNWQITVEPHDLKWKIQQRVSLPSEEQILLIPQ